MQHVCFSFFLVKHFLISGFDKCYINKEEEERESQYKIKHILYNGVIQSLETF